MSLAVTSRSEARQILAAVTRSEARELVLAVVEGIVTRGRDVEAVRLR